MLDRLGYSYAVIEFFESEGHGNIEDIFLVTECILLYLVFELCTDAKKGAEFFNAIVPQVDKSAIPAPPVK